MDIGASEGLAPTSVSTTTPNHHLSLHFTAIIVHTKPNSTFYSLILPYYNNNIIKLIVITDDRQF